MLLDKLEVGSVEREAYTQAAAVAVRSAKWQAAALCGHKC